MSAILVISFKSKVPLGEHYSIDHLDTTKLAHFNVTKGKDGFRITSPKLKRPVIVPLENVAYWIPSEEG